MLNRQKGDILTRHYDNDETAEIFRHRVYLLELGICDLASETYRGYVKSGECDRDIDFLTAQLSELSLKKSGIFSCDNKMRNYVLVKSDECKYDGKIMADYKYWAYHINKNLTVYIPRQKYVVKRIDFLDWGFNPKVEINIEKDKEYLFKECLYDDLSALKQFCTKPVSNSVLNIYPNQGYPKSVVLEQHSPECKDQIRSVHNLFIQPDNTNLENSTDQNGIEKGIVAQLNF